MIEIKSPNQYNNIPCKKSVFLAGSIEMGKADDWQKSIVEELATIDDLLILNPRREAWDTSWEQSIDNPVFREQVEWELDALEYADYIIMYFAPDTKSPITLLELGIHAGKNHEKLIVCCPESFWRKGNVDIVCNRYKVKQVATIQELISELKTKLFSFS